MPQQVKHARPVRMASVGPQMVSQKLRLAGRIIAYDAKAAMVLIVDGQNALFVDISLCLDPSRGMPWLCEINSMVIIIGYLEELQYALPLPALPQHAHEIEVDLRLVVSALLISETSTLDMDLWNRAIADREELANRQTG